MDSWSSEVLVHLLSCLNVRDLCVASSVCRKWHALASENSLWKSQCLAYYSKHNDKAPYPPRLPVCPESNYKATLRTMVDLQAVTANCTVLMLSDTELSKLNYVLDILKGHRFSVKEADLSHVNELDAAPDDPRYRRSKEVFKPSEYTSNEWCTFRHNHTVMRFHETIMEGLDFPDYYGHNLDALDDCLWNWTIEKYPCTVTLLSHASYDLVRTEHFEYRFIEVAIRCFENCNLMADGKLKVIVTFQPSAVQEAQSIFQKYKWL